MSQPEKPLNIQCFVKKDFHPMFGNDNMPKLLYVSAINPAKSLHPRVMHAHKDYIEIVLICSGSSEYLINDTKQFIQEGDLIIYNSGIVHDEISGPDIEVGSYCVAIGGVKLPGFRENALISDSARPIFPTGDSFGDIRAICEMMFRSLSTGQPASESFSNYLAQALIARVLPITRGNTEPAEQEEEPHILGRRIKNYIDQHYMEPTTLEQMGKALNMSPYYLSHVFKEMSGYSPGQYLLRRRVGEAQTLLITTDYPITKIAEMVGYETQSYFNLQFTKNVGMPPRKYRQNYIVPPAESDDKSPARKKKR